MLADAVDMKDSRFVLAAYDRRLAGLDHSHSLDILELLYLEQPNGQLQAMVQVEWDIVQDVFMPFNCRTLLTYS